MDVPVPSVAPSNPYTTSVLFQIGSHPQHLLHADTPLCHAYLQYWVIKSPPWWAVTPGTWHNAHRNFGLKNSTFLSYVLGHHRGDSRGLGEIKTNHWYIRIHNHSALGGTRLEQCEYKSVYYHIVCRPKINAKQMILILQILSLTQFHHSHMFSQYTGHQHYTPEGYMAKYLSANTTSVSRKFPSPGCQKMKNTEGKYY